VNYEKTGMGVLGFPRPRPFGLHRRANYTGSPGVLFFRYRLGRRGFQDQLCGVSQLHGAAAGSTVFALLCLYQPFYFFRGYHHQPGGVSSGPVGNPKIQGRQYTAEHLFMPNLIGGILLGFAWQFIFVQVFDSLSKKFGIFWMAGWLSNQVTGFFGLLIVITWQLSGYMMIIYIAQLQNIPDSLLEAAEVDGVNPLQKLRHIILPLMAPAFTIGLFLSISHAFKLYDMNVALTNGGPSDSTQMLSLNIYQTAFIEGRFGLAQSKAVVFLIVITAVSLIQLKISKSKELEQ
jgi:ABC-type sugar transport system permease subunit